MKLLTKLQIAWLKRKAKKEYIAYRTVGSNYSCGARLADVLCGGKISHHAHTFNQTMDRLAKLDPTTPSMRLEIPQ